MHFILNVGPIKFFQHSKNSKYTFINRQIFNHQSKPGVPLGFLHFLQVIIGLIGVYYGFSF